MKTKIKLLQFFWRFYSGKFEIVQAHFDAFQREKFSYCFIVLTLFHSVLNLLTQTCCCWSYTNKNFNNLHGKLRNKQYWWHIFKFRTTQRNDLHKLIHLSFNFLFALTASSINILYSLTIYYFTFRFIVLRATPVHQLDISHSERRINLFTILLCNWKNITLKDNGWDLLNLKNSKITRRIHCGQKRRRNLWQETKNKII